MNYEQIWLIGFMATGKSRIARPLATALDWESVDIDALIEHEAHDTVAGIFRAGGEAAFRVIESRIVAEVAQRRQIVVATGGGTILSDANRAAMRERGFIACLDARPETIAARIASSSEPMSERPLLRGADPLAAIVELKSARQSLYAQADFIIQTDDMTPDQITHQILLAFRERSTVAGGTV